jgi:hypothetical protein
VWPRALWQWSRARWFRRGLQLPWVKPGWPSRPWKLWLEHGGGDSRGWGDGRQQFGHQTGWPTYHGGFPGQSRPPGNKPQDAVPSGHFGGGQRASESGSFNFVAGGFQPATTPAMLGLTSRWCSQDQPARLLLARLRPTSRPDERWSEPWAQRVRLDSTRSRPGKLASLDAVLARPGKWPSISKMRSRPRSSRSQPRRQPATRSSKLGSRQARLRRILKTRQRNRRTQR